MTLSGKRVQMSCGHTGEVVIGDYVRCLEGCDKEKKFDPSKAVISFGGVEIKGPILGGYHRGLEKISK